jgi:peptide/nickel transport system ATP-binding protein
MLTVGALTVVLAGRRVVDGVSFTIADGQCLGIVGESGSGKTLAALALVGLAPEGARVSGSAMFDGRDLLTLDDRALEALHGDSIGFVFQEPLTALNPVWRIGAQVAEPLIRHRGMTAREAAKSALDALRSAALDDPERIALAYPHELSGGQRQRAMIAMMIACGPKLLIADEPTTALDARVQADVLELLGRLRRERAMAMVLISHDLAAVAHNADQILVLYAGLVMERGPARTISDSPAHPYTRALRAARPRLDAEPGELLPAIPGAPLSGGAPPNACPFAPRCAFAKPECSLQRPDLREIAPGHLVRCVRAGEIGAPT